MVCSQGNNGFKTERKKCCLSTECKRQTKRRWWNRMAVMLVDRKEGREK
jgi:hypothetical protein